MADMEDVRRIAASLPEVSVAVNEAEQLHVAVAGKGFAWTWMERVHPKRARVPQPGVLAVRVANSDEKEALLAADGRKFFTEPHYNGFPAVLVRLAEVGDTELAELLTDAWRVKAPKQLVKDSGL